jgi:hypothetical protein
VIRAVAGVVIIAVVVVVSMAYGVVRQLTDEEWPDW